MRPPRARDLCYSQQDIRSLIACLLGAGSSHGALVYSCLKDIRSPPALNPLMYRLSGYRAWKISQYHSLFSRLSHLSCSFLHVLYLEGILAERLVNSASWALKVSFDSPHRASRIVHTLNALSASLSTSRCTETSSNSSSKYQQAVNCIILEPLVPA